MKRGKEEKKKLVERKSRLWTTPEEDIHGDSMKLKF